MSIFLYHFKRASFNLDSFYIQAIKLSILGGKIYTEILNFIDTNYKYQKLTVLFLFIFLTGDFHNKILLWYYNHFKEKV